MNKLDKFLSVIAPKWAYSRSRARYMAAVVDSAYSGASVTSRKMRSWTPTRGSADRDYSVAAQNTLMARCRDAYRNQPIARAAVDRLKHNVVGTGLRLQAKIDHVALEMDPAEASMLEQQIEREFEIWARSCDIERTLNFSQLQSLAFASMLISGDVFVNTPVIESSGDDYGLRLQVVEADRVSNPNFGMDEQLLRRGVRLDDFGAPIAYNIMTMHPGDLGSVVWKWDEYPVFGGETGRRRIIHLFDRERPGQTRGVPLLAPILEPLRQLERYSDAELTAAVVSSLLTVFVKTQSPEYGMPSYTDSTTDPSNSDEIALGEGAIVDLLPGEDIVTVNPSRPNTKYDPFVMAILKQIAAGLSLPLEFLLLHFISSYSAARAALLQAWRLILYQRKLVSDGLCQPVYELFVDEMMARDRIKHPAMREYWTSSVVRAAWTRARWIGPPRGAIDESKEVQAAEKRISLRVDTRQKIAEELGGADWLDVHRQLVAENEAAKADGLSATAPAEQEEAGLDNDVLDNDVLDNMETLNNG